MPPALSPREQAILSLLSDQDEALVGTVLDRLEDPREIERLLTRIESPPLKKRLLSIHDRHVRRERLAPWRERYRTLRTLAELEEFCWDMALWHRPELQISESRAFLDFWGKTVRDRLPDKADDALTCEILRSVLAREEGLRLPPENVSHPDYGLLDQVIATRRGLPVLLGIIYMLVGARAGLRVEGIPLPGQYAVRLGQRYMDPGEGGRELAKDDVSSLLGRAGIAQDDFWPASETPKRVAHRILTTQRVAAGVRRELELSEAYLEILRASENPDDA
jgi:regulator of sirC expression with transglutaminase-like and TPR domain